MFEEGNRNSSGAYMGSDGGSQSADGKFLCVILPQMFAVVNVFLQQLITQTGITQTERTGEIHTVSFHQCECVELDISLCRDLIIQLAH